MTAAEKRYPDWVQEQRTRGTTGPLGAELPYCLGKSVFLHFDPAQGYFFLSAFYDR